ncbi:MAG TPA: amidohydrolase family protein [Cyclobacteriaceae bacterium]|nr:amidohydrolase family protein [Cyclobacteriaceae bacterium]
MKRFIYLVLFGLIFAVSSLAQVSNQMPVVTRTYAFTNINIVQGPGRRMDNATLLIKDGLIAGVGKNISIPPDAIVIKADSMYAYAGFIDGLCKSGVSAHYNGSSEKVLDPGSPPPALAGINPQNEVRTMLNPDDKEIEQLRNLGFTTAQVIPQGNFLPGQAAVILLNGKSANEMLLVNKSALYTDLIGTRGIYPSTILGVMAKWRELYRQSELAKTFEHMYASNPTGLIRPTSDRILEAFYPVIDQQLPVLVKSEKMMDVQHALALKSDLGFLLLLADVKEGWPLTKNIKASGAKVFLSLDLPEEKKMKTSTEKPTAFDVEREDLEKRKADAVSKCNAQPVNFQRAGIAFGFCSYSAKVKDIPANLRRMISAGLTEDEALAALTTTPAKFLGLSDRMGTVDQGMIANLVISDKSYFLENAKVQYVIVDGNVYPIETKTGIKIEGGWTIVIQTSRGSMNDRLHIRKEGNTYAGTYFSESLPAPVDLREVSLKGNLLSFKYKLGNNPDAPDMVAEVTVTGKTFKGVVNGARFKNLAIEGVLDTRNR